MYKVIYIGADYSTTKLVEQAERPDPEQVACFSGDELDPVAHIYTDPYSDSAKQTKRWADKNQYQKILFEIYYNDNNNK